MAATAKISTIDEHGISKTKKKGSKDSRHHKYHYAKEHTNHLFSESINSLVSDIQFTKNSRVPTSHDEEPSAPNKLLPPCVIVPKSSIKAANSVVMVMAVAVAVLVVADLASVADLATVAMLSIRPTEAACWRAKGRL